MPARPLQIPGPLLRPGRARRRRWRHLLCQPLQQTAAALAPRLLTLGAALVLLPLLAPVLLVRALVSWAQTGRLLTSEVRLGQGRRRFACWRFAGRGPGRGLAVWLNLLRGELVLVGPRALTPAAAAALPLADAVRFRVPPGLISRYWLRQRLGIAHRAESHLERDYVYAQSAGGDLALLVRAGVARLLGGAQVTPRCPPVLDFFGIPIVNTSMAEAVAWIIAASAPAAATAAFAPPAQVAFVNPDCLNIAWADPHYRALLLDAERVLPDGIGLRIGGRLLGQPLQENINGTDLFPLLCSAARAAGRSLYLLGARPGIAAAAAARMQQRFPGLRIAGTQDGYFAPAATPAVIAAINASGADILLVAFGVPHQETWISAHRADLRVRVCMGVGGLFDFYSGRIRRAPPWLRELGLEWLYRLLQEPGRMWRRYVIGNPLFLYRVWRQARDPARWAVPPAPMAVPAPPPRRFPE